MTVTFEDCAVGTFVEVDFHRMRTDGGLNAYAFNANRRVVPGDPIVAVELHEGWMRGTVREVNGEKLVLDLAGYFTECTA